MPPECGGHWPILLPERQGMPVSRRALAGVLVLFDRRVHARVDLLSDNHLRAGRHSAEQVNPLTPRHVLPDRTKRLSERGAEDVELGG